MGIFNAESFSKLHDQMIDFPHKHSDFLKLNGSSFITIRKGKKIRLFMTMWPLEFSSGVK